MDNCILVTGGAGLIGSHTVEELSSKNNKIVVFDSMIRGKEKYLLNTNCSDLVIIKGDIRDYELLEKTFQKHKFNKVFHFAASWLRQCQEDPQMSLDVNIIGTFNILKLCVKYDIQKIVAASSSSVYGESDYLPTDEKHPFNNDLFYGASKITNEQHYISFRKKFNLNFNAMRFLNIYGPKQPTQAAYMDVIMNFFKKVINNEQPIIRGDGSPTVDLVYASDAAKACVLAMESEVSGEFFNVASGRETSLLELSNMIIEICGKKNKITPRFEEAYDSGLVTRRLGCPKKAFEILGFKTSVEPFEGLRNLYNYIKSNKNEP